VIVDVEPFFVLVLNLNYPLHGFLHTFLGGTIVAIILSGILYRFRGAMNKIMGVFKLSQESSFKTILFSCIVGVYFHIFLDSFLFADIKPFLPLDTNPLYGLVSYNLMYLFCGSSFVLGGLLYAVKLSRGKTRLILKVVSSFIFAGFIIIMLGLYWLSWAHSPFDDGPFIGVNYAEDIEVHPNSKITLGNNYVFEAYNGVDERAPILVLRDNNEKLMWARLMVVSDVKNYENCKVHELELSRGRKTPTGYHVQGVAFWTYGHEAVNFYLDREGKLKEFYLSW